MYEALKATLLGSTSVQFGKSFPSASFSSQGGRDGLLEIPSTPCSGSATG